MARTTKKAPVKKAPAKKAPAKKVTVKKAPAKKAPAKKVAAKKAPAKKVVNPKQKIRKQRTPIGVERTAVLIAGKPFWVDISVGPAMIQIEGATRGMTRDEFNDWAIRYRVRLEVWAHPTKDVRTVLCDKDQGIVGNWL